MSTLSLQSSTVKGYAERGGLVYVFTAGGVDLYRPDLRGWTRIGFAALTNVTCGAVNEVGAWLGTSDRGVWFVTDLDGDSTPRLVNIYRETGAGSVVPILSDNVLGMCGDGSRLLVISDAGADYFPAPGVPWTYALTGMPGACAMNATKIAYAVTAALHVRNNPTANWTTTGTTVLTTTSTPAIASNTVNALAYGTDLFAATGAGLSVYDGTDVSTFVSGTAILGCWPTATATQAAGQVAYNTAAAVKIFDIAAGTEIENLTSTATRAWIDDSIEALVYGNALQQYTTALFASPGPDVVGVRRDWSLYLEVTDTLHGLLASTIGLKVDGVTVTPTVTTPSDFNADFSADFGGSRHIVTFTPASASGYRQRHTIALTATDAAGNAIAYSWSFTTATEASAAASSYAPPNVVVMKDLSLAASEAEETYAAVAVNWADEISHPLIVTEAQATAVGTAKVKAGIYHRHVRQLRLLKTDSNGANTCDLQQGDIIAFTASALSEMAKKAEVLSVQRAIDNGLEDSEEYAVTVAYYDLYS